MRTKNPTGVLKVLQLGRHSLERCECRKAHAGNQPGMHHDDQRDTHVKQLLAAELRQSVALQQGPTKPVGNAETAPASGRFRTELLNCKVARDSGLQDCSNYPTSKHLEGCFEGGCRKPKKVGCFDSFSAFM